MYCTDLALFDEKYRPLGKDETLVHSIKGHTDNFLKLADQIEGSTKKVLKDGQHAVVMFSNLSAGPAMLHSSPRGWVIDITSERDHIKYSGDGWMALVGDYPYLPLIIKGGASEHGLSQEGARVVALPGGPLKTKFYHFGH
jgi:hypothetical protein